MKINKETDALIIIDMQNDFALSDGALYVKNGIDIADSIAVVAGQFDNIFFTQDNHPEGHKSFASAHNKNPFEVIEMYGHTQMLWPDHCVQHSLGNDIVEELWDARDRAIAIVRKGMNPNVDSYSAFRENFAADGNRATTGFAGMLRERGIKRVFLVGLARDYCVRFSAEDAVDEGFETYVIDDLTKSVVTTDEAITAVTKALMDKGISLINIYAVTGF